MEEIRQYVLSLIAVSVICSIVKKLTGKDSIYTPIVRIICGLFIAVTIISPWIEMDFANFNILTDSVYVQAQTVVDSGKAAANTAVEERIIEQTETYILDKAISLGADVSVEIALDSAGLLPYSAAITGDISPYTKNTLSQYIESTLAIPEERQQWI